MRGTAATQVAIDYESEADFIKKFRVANCISPLLALRYDKAKVFEGEPYHGHMLRAKIWNDVDPSRSGIVPDALDKTFGFRDYAEYVCKTPSIFNADAAYLLSLVFPDVRLNTYIEIRVADSMPISDALKYCEQIRVLFYCVETLEFLFQATKNVTNDDVKRAKQSLIRDGYNGEVYGKSAREWVKLCFN
jgi:glutamate--cysteine ligase